MRNKSNKITPKDISKSITGSIGAGRITVKPPTNLKPKDNPKK